MAAAAFVGLGFGGQGDDGTAGGVLVVQLSNAANATLPASFTVTATGTTTAGYGPTAIGPLALSRCE